MATVFVLLMMVSCWWINMTRIGEAMSLTVKTANEDQKFESGTGNKQSLKCDFVHLNGTDWKLDCLDRRLSKFPDIREYVNEQITKLPDISERWIGGLMKLREIDLTHNEIWHIKSNELLQDDGIFDDVLVLNISHNDLQEIPDLRMFPNLRILDLTGNSIKKVDHSVLWMNHQMQELYLDHNYLTDVSPYFLLPMPNLRHFSLHGCSINDVDFIISAPRGLEVNLKSNYVSDVQSESVILAAKHLKIIPEDLTNNWVQYQQHLQNKSQSS